MTITAKKNGIERLEVALIIARQSGNHRLVSTIKDMLRVEYARSVKSTCAVEVNVPSKKVKTVYNPKRASVKLKSELYDSRVYAPPAKAVKRRYIKSITV